VTAARIRYGLWRNQQEIFSSSKGCFSSRALSVVRDTIRWDLLNSFRCGVRLKEGSEGTGLTWIPKLATVKRHVMKLTSTSISLCIFPPSTIPDTFCSRNARRCHHFPHQGIRSRVFKSSTRPKHRDADTKEEETNSPSPFVLNDPIREMRHHRCVC
jgi:hypothetical protein